MAATKAPHCTAERPLSSRLGQGLPDALVRNEPRGAVPADATYNDAHGSAAVNASSLTRLGDDKKYF